MVFIMPVAQVEGRALLIRVILLWRSLLPTEHAATYQGVAESLWAGFV